jgi:hypothetical protein
MVFYYKIACLYFGAADYDSTIIYLNKIIHWKVDLRIDLQCYARLLHLISHYELGNYELVQYLIKSVYRFMAKMQHLSVVEKEIFKFLKQSFQINRQQVKEAFTLLREKLKQFEVNPLETRSFMYLDIISWLESKIKGVAVQAIIKERWLEKTRQTVVE